MNVRCLLFAFGALSVAPLWASESFTIQVIDSQTGRGVPQVELRHSGQTPIAWMTDSNGIVAVTDPALLSQSLFVDFRSYGHSNAGQTIPMTPGGNVQVTINRQNLAERLYRVTGTGIYQDSVLVGHDVPIEHPLLNANVKGQDSAQTTVYKGKIFWVWGDTAYESGGYNFRAAGATSELPGQGGLDPSLGVNLNYFVTAQGSAKQMMPLQGTGLVWLDGLFTAHDNDGQERMLAHFVRVAGDFSLYEHGLARFNDISETFVRHENYDLEAPITPQGHAFRHTVDGEEYIYFAQGYPNVRVKADWDHITDISKWEAFTPLQENSRYVRTNPPLDLDDQGNPNFGWKKNTDPMDWSMLDELVRDGHLVRDESPFRLKNHQTGQIIHVQRSSVQWNEYRQSWIMIGQEVFGTSFLGEIWFAEAPTPEGPWEGAVKVVTHTRPGAHYSFYNPVLHPYFDEEAGRYIYFEGTYTNQFTSTPETPLYDYNQVMYRLDLATIPDLFPRLAGDYNRDGVVDAADYILWRKTLGSKTNLAADGNRNGEIDPEDYEIWRMNFGNSDGGAVESSLAVVPEPNSLFLGLVAGVATIRSIARTRGARVQSAIPARRPASVLAVESCQ